jgi:hypothetical protein
MEVAPPTQDRNAGFDLDALLTPAAAAVWLHIAERTLLDNARRKKIPVIRINARLLRFHPRSVLAFASKGGK